MAEQEAEEIVHIVDDDDLEMFAAGRLSVMHSLCGEAMPNTGLDDLDDPYGSPLCPRCFELSGWTEDRRRENTVMVDS